MNYPHSYIRQRKVIISCTKVISKWNTTAVSSQHQELRRSRWFLSAARRLPGCCLVLSRRWWWSPGPALPAAVPALCRSWWCLVPPSSSLRPPDTPASPPVTLPAPLLWRFQFLEESKLRKHYLNFLNTELFKVRRDNSTCFVRNLIILQCNTKILILLV